MKKKSYPKEYKARVAFEAMKGEKTLTELSSVKYFLCQDQLQVSLRRKIFNTFWFKFNP